MTATGFFVALGFGVALAFGATGATGAASTTNGIGVVAAGASTLYGADSGFTSGAVVPGKGLPVNQLVINFNISVSPMRLFISDSSLGKSLDL